MTQLRRAYTEHNMCNHLLIGGCLSGVLRSLERKPPSRGDPEPDINSPYFSRRTLIACPKMWAKTAEFAAAACLNCHTLT